MSDPCDTIEHTFDLAVEAGPEVAMLAKPLLFLSSYTPLFALLAIRFQPLHLIIICASLAVAGLLGLLLLFRLDARASRGAHELAVVRDAGGEAASYLGAYLLPFVTVSTPSARDLIAYGGFMIVAGAVYIHSSVVQINPLLYLLGYRIYATEDTNGLQAYLVTRRKHRVGDSIEATRFRDSVVIERTPRKPTNL
jgi:hypothetical protein